MGKEAMENLRGQKLGKYTLTQEIGRAARDIEGVLVVEVRRGGRRIGCWQDKGLVIEPGDRLLVIDSDAVLAGTA